MHIHTHKYIQIHIDAYIQSDLLRLESKYPSSRCIQPVELKTPRSAFPPPPRLVLYNGRVADADLLRRAISKELGKESIDQNDVTGDGMLQHNCRPVLHPYAKTRWSLLASVEPSSLRCRLHLGEVIIRNTATRSFLKSLKRTLSKNRDVSVWSSDLIGPVKS